MTTPTSSTPTEREPRTDAGRALLAAHEPNNNGWQTRRPDLARAILAIEREAAGAATETGGLVTELADACEGLMPFVRIGPGPLGDDPAAKAMRRALDALGTARLSVHPDREDAPAGGGVT